jgi:hypothetical protein
MRFNRFYVGAALAALGALPTATSALATCTNAMASGTTWHFHAFEAGTDVGGGSVIRCVATFGASGAFTAPCRVFNVGTSTQNATNTHGTMTLSAQCDLTGSIVIPGGDPRVMIKYGHVNGNIGSGTAIQGTGTSTQVLHFTLVKQ